MKCHRFTSICFSTKYKKYTVLSLAFVVLLIIVCFAGYLAYKANQTILTNKKIIELFESATPAETVSTTIPITPKSHPTKQNIEINNNAPIPILVIASTDNQDYIDFINHYWIPLLLWLEKHRTPELNVYIYLIFGAGNSFEKVPIPEEIHKYFLVFEDIPETYTPGILQKTVRGFEEMNAKHPDYEVLYRTNISTFLLLDRIIDRINTVISQNGHGKHNIYSGYTFLSSTPGIVDNKLNINPNVKFISGIDIMLSKDVVEFLIVNKEKLNYNIIDDLEIGRFLHENNNIISEQTSSHILFECKPADYDMAKYLVDLVTKLNDYKIMLVRLKCYDSLGSRKNDLIVMKHLFSIFYK